MTDPRVSRRVNELLDLIEEADRLRNTTWGFRRVESDEDHASRTEEIGKCEREIDRLKSELRVLLSDD